MTLQVHPIALGCMLVVAVGTLLYTYMTRPQPQQQGYERSDNYYDFPDNLSRASSKSSVSNNGERSRKRKKSDLCTICLAPLKSDLKTLTCDHVFHGHCITTWLISSSTCPLCRKEAHI